MDFFAHQEAAARRSRILIAYFILAVILTILAVYGAATGIFFVAAKSGDSQGPEFWSLPRLAVIAACTLGLIISGTVYRVAQLGGGGASVAQLLGGRLVPPGSRDLKERRALNVVEEMALAAGTPVPPLYVMDEEHSINAFAAGYSPRDAVVAVTRGTLDSLNREELQAVVGHEFSHILNGDMRLNIRLMGLLNGILLLAIVGHGLLRSMGRMRSSSKKGDARAPVALFAVALIIIGFIGVFFGRLIKSAVSRQREFLADAASAQFTRNPVALAGALRKIAAAGARVSSPHAEDASHLFFANALASSWFSLMATHPPVEERIRRLDPQGQGGRVPPGEPIASSAVPPATSTAHASTVSLSGFSARVGSQDSRALSAAESLLQTMSAPLLDAARDPTRVIPLVLATLLDAGLTVRQTQLNTLHGILDSADVDATRKLADMIRTAGHGVRLPLLALAVPAMKQMSPTQFATLQRTTRALTEADKQVDLFEFVMQRMITKQVEPAFRPVRRTQSVSIGWSGARDALTCLLSCLAYWGADDETAAIRAFTAGAAELPSSLALKLLPLEACGLNAFGSALDDLEAISFELKRRILKACVACVGSDDMATIEEAELLRAVADSLDCPVPPIFAGPVDSHA